MIVNGIIAECNPLHNGHQLHITQSKALCGADYTVVVMSGNFMQRGCPAIFDKYARTEMLLSSGADLVIELPAIYAASSAEYFATAAVTLLDKLNVITHLSFGSESGDVSQLQKYAKILLDEPQEYAELLHAYLRQGQSFPLARNNALVQYDSSLYDATTTLNSPNNILAIEYLKALMKRGSHIIPQTTRRTGAGYHDRYMTASSVTSALAIRQAILTDHADPATLIHVVPERAHEILTAQLSQSVPMDCDDFSAMLYYKLLSERKKGYTTYLDVTPELSDRIANNLNQFISFTQFCDLLKSKDRTYTRISRCLLHILLNITNSDMENGKMLDYTPYAKVLGFKKSATPLLSEIKVRSSIPMLTKLTDAKEKLYSEPYAMLEKDIQINDIYLAGQSLKMGKPAKSEFSTPLVILEDV